MNFIFLTTMMILIFSLVSTSMTRSLKTTAHANFQLEKHIDSLYRYENSLAKKIYAQSKKYKKKSNQSRKAAREGNSFHPRISCTGENSKLNLYPLIGGNYSLEQKQLITKTFNSLLYELYSKEPFYKQLIEKEQLFFKKFADKIFLGLKKSKSLAKISFSSRKDRELYLMLCKGSYKSSTKTKPLLDYISLHEIDAGPFIVFGNLSKPVIVAFFGNEMSYKIFQEEEKVYFEGRPIARLTENEVNKLLTSPNYHLHKKLLSYKKFTYKNNQNRIKISEGAIITLGPPAEDL